jgi:hypothetical protein
VAESPPAPLGGISSLNGGNGKGRLVRLMEECLGDYFQAVSPSLNLWISGIIAEYWPDDFYLLSL